MALDYGSGRDRQIKREGLCTRRVEPCSSGRNCHPRWGWETKMEDLQIRVIRGEMIGILIAIRRPKLKANKGLCGGELGWIPKSDSAQPWNFISFRDVAINYWLLPRGSFNRTGDGYLWYLKGRKFFRPNLKTLDSDLQAGTCLLRSPSRLRYTQPVPFSDQSTDGSLQWISFQSFFDFELTD